MWHNMLHKGHALAFSVFVEGSLTFSVFAEGSTEVLMWRSPSTLIRSLEKLYNYVREATHSWKRYVNMCYARSIITITIIIILRDVWWPMFSQYQLSTFLTSVQGDIMCDHMCNMHGVVVCSSYKAPRRISWFLWCLHSRSSIFIILFSGTERVKHGMLWCTMTYSDYPYS